ncbi:MAG: glycosyltransferase [Desulfovibrio sp.]
MKVLHIGKYFPPVPGGIENFLSDLVTAQRGLGIDSRVLCHQYNGEALSNPLDAVPVRRVRTYGVFCYVPLSPSFPVILREEIRSFAPDVIHVHMPNVSGFLLPGNYKGKVVVHWHSDVVFPKEKFIHTQLYRFYSFFERRLLDRADTIIGTSPPYLEASKVLKPYRSKAALVPLGLQNSRITAVSVSTKERVRRKYLSEAERALGGKMLITVGRLAHYKGLRYLIDAMKGTASHLVIVGDGELRKELEERVRSKRLDKKVTFTGYVDDKAMNELLSAADLCCLPSTDRSEAFGLIQLEAMSLKVPCLSTSIAGSGTGWVNKDGMTGVVVPPADTAKLHEVIVNAESGAIDLATLGNTAYEYFMDHYNISAIAQKVNDLYELSTNQNTRL